MPAKPNEIRIVRVYDAPVKLVWDAWTDLKHVERWWGPRGFTLTTRSKDLRPGGRWIYTMHGPDGTDYPNVTTYHEVVPYEKLVYDHGGSEERDKLFTVTVTFKEERGRTTMDMTMALPTPDEAKAMKQFIRKANGNSTWDRLGEYLDAEATGRDSFFIHRSFPADIETVFGMWVDAGHLSKWLGPKGSSLSFIGTDIREGGSARFAMTHADGQAMYAQIDYRKIRPHHLLVYTQYFCDENGKRVKPPFAPSWPDAMLMTVAFAEEGPAATRVTVRCEVHGEAGDVERRTFHDAKSGMTEGWNGSFDKLEEALTSPGR